LELLWFEDRLSAYLVQIQGSAKIILTDGSRVSVAVAGTTAHEYTSIGKELVQDGVFAPGTVTLPLILDYFRHQPQQLNNYLPRNQRFVFFKLTPANSRAQGSLGVPVTAERSIATDKALMPPGALALIEVPIPNAKLQKVPNLRFVLDQDTGSAIKGPGRVDIFMGTGSLAGERAGLMSDDGQLYYLLSKN
jgi:membrane-bound lytic murein transglycosylase A